MLCGKKKSYNKYLGLFDLTIIIIPSLTYASFCGTVCVTKGGDTDGEIHIRRDYVWREVQH